MKKLLINIGKFLLSLSLGLGILWYVYHTQSKGYQQQQCFVTQCEPAGIAIEDCQCDDATLATFSLTDKLWEDFSSVHLVWILLSIGIYLISNLSRAIRWRMMVEPLGTRMSLRNTFMAVMVGYLANTLLPRAGEVAQCGVLSRYEGIGVEKLFGTITVSRIIDVLSLGIVTGLMFLFEYQKVWSFFSGGGIDSGSQESGNGLFILLGLGLLGLAAFGLMFWQKEKLFKYPIFRKLFNFMYGFWEGIRAVGKVRSVGLFIMHSIIIWGCYYLMHYVAFFAFDPIAGLPPVAGLTIFVFGSLGMVVPVPGGMGAYQWLVKTAFVTFYGIAAAEAFSAANILFWPIFLTNIVLGLISFILLRMLNERKLEAA